MAISRQSRSDNYWRSQCQESWNELTREDRESYGIRDPVTSAATAVTAVLSGAARTRPRNLEKLIVATQGFPCPLAQRDSR
jgi:hypothetical protein